MKLPHTFDPSRCVLFLGSGFSTGCRNVANREIPSVRTIENEFHDELNIKQGTYEIQQLADFLRRKNFNFNKCVIDNFTTRSTNSYIDNISDHKWMRVYTTNYDDVYEFSQSNKKIRYNSFNYKDQTPRKIPLNSIIHLHGYVRNTIDLNDPDKTFVLDKKSYARTEVRNSQWWDQFESDMQNAHHIFFLGYSLNDPHIKDVLIQNPERTPKTHFIVHSSMDYLLQDTLSEYGSVETISISGFSDYIKEAITNHINTDIPIERMKSIRHINANKDNKPVAKATIPELFDLLTYGKVNDYKLINRNASKGYICRRSALIANCITQIKSGKDLLINAWLGNGKSIFAKVLAYAATAEGYNVFIRNTNYVLDADEVENLSKIDRALVFFDGPPPNLEEVSTIRDRIPEAKFCLTLRTGFVETNYAMIEKNYSDNFSEIDINHLDTSDVAELHEIVQKAGHKSAIIDPNRPYVREFVIEHFKNAAVQKTIIDSFRRSLNDDSSEFLLCVLLYRLYNITPPNSILREISSNDPYKILRTNREHLSEFFDYSDGRISARSSIVSEILVQECFEPKRIARCITNIIELSVIKTKGERIDEETGSFLRYNRLFQILGSTSEATVHIEKMFEKLRFNSNVSYHPLFWLQYSFVHSDDNIGIAEAHINEAYNLAKEIKGFKTYQLDTQALRVSLRAEARSESFRVTRFEYIKNRILDCKKLISDAKHLQHVLKALSELPSFIHSRGKRLSSGEARTLRHIVLDVLVDLARIDDVYRARFGISKSEADLQSVERILASQALTADADSGQSPD